MATIICLLSCSGMNSVARNRRVTTRWRGRRRSCTLRAIPTGVRVTTTGCIPSVRRNARSLVSTLPTKVCSLGALFLHVTRSSHMCIMINEVGETILYQARLVCHVQIVLEQRSVVLTLGWTNRVSGVSHAGMLGLLPSIIKSVCRYFASGT